MNTTFAFRPAQREQVPLLIGLVGPSGGGKTYSALRLAKGIQSVAGGKIAVIDTEARRALHYAGRFQFDYTEFKPPFGSIRYAEVLQAAVEHGARTIVVDSMSHEHEGAGGYLETHEAELDRMAGEGADYRRREALKFAAWIKPAGNRRKLINAILQLNANFIFCFRAKEKLALVKDEKGKTVPVPLGWQAIAGEEFVYEMGVRCLLLPGANGTPDWSPESMKHGVPKLSEDHRTLLPPGRQLDEDVGRQLAEWAKGDAPAARTTVTSGAPEQEHDLLALGESAAALGTERLKVWFEGLPKAAKVAIKPHIEALKKAAAQADATPDVAFDDTPPTPEHDADGVVIELRPGATEPPLVEDPPPNPNAWPLKDATGMDLGVVGDGMSFAKRLDRLIEAAQDDETRTALMNANSASIERLKVEGDSNALTLLGIAAPKKKAAK